MSWKERFHYFQAQQDLVFKTRRQKKPEYYTLASWENAYLTRLLAAEIPSQGKLVDFGCGSGELDICLARQLPQLTITGLDISQAALGLAQEHCQQEAEAVRQRLQWQAGNFEQTVFPAREYAGGMAVHVLDYVKDLGSFLYNAAQCLLPGAGFWVVVAGASQQPEPGVCWNLPEPEWAQVLSLYGVVEKAWTSPDKTDLIFKVSLKQQATVAGMLLLQKEEDAWERTLASTEKWVQSWAVLDLRKTGLSGQWQASYPKIKAYQHVLAGGQNSAVLAANQMLKMALALKPEWLLWLHGNETLEAGGEDFLQQELNRSAPQIGAYALDRVPAQNPGDPGCVQGFLEEQGRNPRLFRIQGTQPGQLRFAPAIARSHTGRVELLGLRGSLEYLPIKIYAATQSKPAADESFHPAELRFPARAAFLSKPMPDLPMYYSFLRSEVLEQVPKHAKKILEFGCAGGRLGRAIKERQICYLAGVELNPLAAEAAWKYFDEVLTTDLDTLELPYPPGHFDCVICADVLEHLQDPWKIVKKIQELLAPGGVMVCSLPNVRNVKILNQLIHGQWSYQDAGILDRTHLRFFTREEFSHVAETCGLASPKIIWIKDPELAHLAFPAGMNKTELVFGRWVLKNVSQDEFAEWTAVQMLVIGAKSMSRPANAQPVPNQAMAGKHKMVQAAGSAKANSQPRLEQVSIIVLTHNQRSYTQQCLESIRLQTPEAHELIVVDNHSTDDTLEYLAQTKKNWEQETHGQACRGFKIISNQANLGFAGGNNCGIAQASGNFILLLNNDTVVTPHWLERMLHCARKNPRSGIIGPMSNNISGPQRVYQVTYDQEHVRGLQAFAEDWGKKHAGQARPFWRVVGFCMLIKREVIDTIGGLDSCFGRGNFEDDDFSLRAAAAGFESWLALDSFVHHFGSRTFVGEKIDYAQSLRQNWEIFKKKWGLPGDAELGSPLDVSKIVERGPRPEHYCAIEF